MPQTRELADLKRYFKGNGKNIWQNRSKMSLSTPEEVEITLILGTY